MSTFLRETDTAGIERLLVGRRIINAERGSFTRPFNDWGSAVTGRLTLDDGTQVLIAPNEGDCACSGGDYFLEHLAKVDNAITSVRVTEESTDGYGTAYRIYVVADAEEINVASIEGDDGSGYYGTGYELIVLDPSETK